MDLWRVAPWNGRLALGAAAACVALSVAAFLPIPATADAVGAALVAAFLALAIAALSKVRVSWRVWDLRIQRRVHAVPPGHGAPRRGRTSSRGCVRTSATRRRWTSRSSRAAS